MPLQPTLACRASRDHTTRLLVVDRIGYHQISFSITSASSKSCSQIDCLVEDIGTPCKRIELNVIVADLSTGIGGVQQVEALDRVFAIPQAFCNPIPDNLGAVVDDVDGINGWDWRCMDDIVEIELLAWECDGAERLSFEGQDGVRCLVEAIGKDGLACGVRSVSVRVGQHGLECCSERCGSGICQACACWAWMPPAWWAKGSRQSAGGERCKQKSLELHDEMDLDVWLNECG